MAEVSVQTVLPMTIQDVAVVEDEISPEDVPLPRSSMITVRLSEVSVLSDLDEDLDLKAPQDNGTPESSPPSTRSSRSSSQTSGSSISLNSVNWEGLEKTEEQEPRDEATDEVSLTGPCPPMA